MENRVTISGLPADGATEAELTPLLERGFSKLKRFKGLRTAELAVGVEADGLGCVAAVSGPSGLALLRSPDGRTQWVPWHDLRSDGLRLLPPHLRAVVVEYHLENAAERAVAHFDGFLLPEAADYWAVSMATRSEADDLLEGADQWLRPDMVETYQVGTEAEPVPVPLRLTFKAGTGGGKAWDAAIHFGRWILRHPELFEGRTVAELGCGLGLPSMVALRFARRVLLTDFVSELLDNLEFNVRQNSELTADPEAYRRRAQVQRLDWKLFREGDVEKVDVVIFSDVVYNHDVAMLLPRVIKGLLRRGGHVYAVMPDARAGLHDFFSAMRDAGFAHEKSHMPRDCMAGDDSVTLVSRLHKFELL